MKASARILIAFTLFAGSAARAQDPVGFVKDVISDPAATTWASVTYPNNHLEVEFNLRPYAHSDSEIVAAFGSVAKQIVPKAFQLFPQLNAVHIKGTITGIDKRGNDATVTAAMVQFSRGTSASIRWERVKVEDVINIADRHSADRSLTR